MRLKGVHRSSKKANPASPSIIDLTAVPVEFTDEEVDRATSVLFTLDTAVFAGLDEDIVVSICKRRLLEGVL